MSVTTGESPSQALFCCAPENIVKSFDLHLWICKEMYQ